MRIKKLITWIKLSLICNGRSPSTFDICSTRFVIKFSVQLLLLRPAQILPCNFRSWDEVHEFNWLRFAIRMQFVPKLQSHHNISASLPRLLCPITPIRRLASRIHHSEHSIAALFASKEKIINDSTGSNLIWWWAKTGPKLVLVLLCCVLRYHYCVHSVFPLWRWRGWSGYLRDWSDPELMCPRCGVSDQWPVSRPHGPLLQL